jgi:type IV pilus assembly protein PilX
VTLRGVTTMQTKLMQTDDGLCRLMHARSSQSGAALMVALIFLLVISIIAVAGVRSTTLQERMAGNTRDRNLAFQAAESGVREAEVFIESLASLGNFDGTDGLYGVTDSEPDYSTGSTWTTSGTYIVADDSYGSYSAPRYYIKHFTTAVGTEGAMNLSGYGDNKGSGDVSVFRITGRGTGGGADSAEVIVRSQYGRIF